MSSLNDRDNYNGRVNFAAFIITQGKPTSRSFDNCFENWDGDAVAAALVKRSLKNERLARNLFKYVNQQSATACYEEHKGKNLTQLARELRAIAEKRSAQS